MKGNVAILIIALCVVLPLLFAAMRLKGRHFMFASIALGVAGGGMLVAHIAFGFEFTENLTSSLDGHIYAYRQGAPFRHGDTIAFYWHGGASYPQGVVFIKQVVGMPGDTVRVVGRQVWVNDRYIGEAKAYTRAGVPLTPAEGGVIAVGEYFVSTPNPNSLDSRYALTGNIKASRIIGRAYEFF